MKEKFAPSQLPRSYQEAVKNQYLGHLRLMYSYIESGHMTHAHEAQLRAEEIIQVLLKLGEKGLHRKLVDIGAEMSSKIFTRRRANVFGDIDKAFIERIRRPLNRKKKE